MDGVFVFGLLETVILGNASNILYVKNPPVVIDFISMNYRIPIKYSMCYFPTLYSKIEVIFSELLQMVIGHNMYKISITND